VYSHRVMPVMMSVVAMIVSVVMVFLFFGVIFVLALVFVCGCCVI
jgi:hypothetical protein